MPQASGHHTLPAAFVTPEGKDATKIPLPAKRLAGNKPYLNACNTAFYVIAIQEKTPDMKCNILPDLNNSSPLAPPSFAHAPQVPVGSQKNLPLAERRRRVGALSQ